jgi:uncharacterized LabA/DUF88 family protein
MTNNTVQPKLENIELLQSLPQPIGVFIDMGNLFFIQKKLGFWVDFAKFKNIFSDSTNLFYFTAYNPDNPKELAKMSKIKNLGYKMITRKIELIAGKHKGNLDVEITWEMCENQDKFNSFVLVSGDGDFAFILDKLASKGKKSVVVATNAMLNKNLRRFKTIDVKNIQGQISR